MGARSGARRKRSELRERRKSGNAIERRSEVTTRESTSCGRRLGQRGLARRPQQAAHTSTGDESTH